MEAIPKLIPRSYVQSLPFTQKVPWTELYPNSDPNALDILEQLLKFNPAKRINAVEGLAHPYIEQYYDPLDEPVMANPFTIEMEVVPGPAEMFKSKIFREAQALANRYT